MTSKKKGHDVRKTIISSSGLLVLLVVLILVNVLFSYANIRWDATEDRIYSLSEGTQRVLSKMTQEMTVKFFFSASNRNLPTGLKLFGKRIREFLNEYEHASDGMLKVELHDPKPDSDEEEWAQKYGLRAMGAGGGERIYAGLVFLAAEQEARIEFLDPSREELLEYDITRIIHRLQTVERKRIGIISSLPVLRPGQQSPMAPQQGPQQWFFVSELKKTYEVELIPLDSKKIDPELALLLIVHPKLLNDNLQYAVDQFVLHGGNAVIFVDPVPVSDRRQQQREPPKASDLDKLLAAWGVELEPGKAVADLELATRVRMGGGVEENPVWISAQGGAFDRSDVVTSKLERMLFPVAGALRKVEGSPHEVVPLVRTSKNASLVDAFVAGFGAATIRTDVTPAGERFNLAVRVRGEFETAFPDGPPRKEGEEPPADETAHLSKAVKPANLIIVADADMLADDFYLQRSNMLGFAMSRVFNDNLNFVANACEMLTGSDDLIGLRSRGKFERPFTRVQDLRRKAQERWLAKEKELMERADETNRKLRELEQGKDASHRTILSAEQENEIARFREQRLQINRELKGVRKNLRADIEALGVRLKAFNLFLIPVLVSLAGVAFAVYRQKRMRRK